MLGDWRKITARLLLSLEKNGLILCTGESGNVLSTIDQALHYEENSNFVKKTLNMDIYYIPKALFKKLVKNIY